MVNLGSNKIERAEDEHQHGRHFSYPRTTLRVAYMMYVLMNTCTVNGNDVFTSTICRWGKRSITQPDVGFPAVTIHQKWKNRWWMWRYFEVKSTQCSRKKLLKRNTYYKPLRTRREYVTYNKNIMQDCLIHCINNEMRFFLLSDTIVTI